MESATIHPWVKKLLAEFIRDGFQGYVINCRDSLDKEATSPSFKELEQLSRPFEDILNARHEGLKLAFRGSKAYRMSDLEVTLKVPWVIKAGEFFVVISNATAEHLYDGAMPHHTIVLYAIKYGRILGNALVLSRFDHFSPNAKAGL